MHITQLVTSPQALVAANKFAPSTLAALVEHAKAKPDTVNYGTVGTGSSNHLNMLTLRARGRARGWCTCPTRAARR